MKKLILLLTLFSTTLFAQNSWINIQLMTDNYPNETSWQITPSNGSPIIIGQDPAQGINQLYDTTIAVQGLFIASVFDSYGDGLGASQWGGTDGWFLIQNDCQDTIMFVAGDFGVSHILIHYNIAPCAPPTGWLFRFTIATNYDSTATIAAWELYFWFWLYGPNSNQLRPLAVFSDSSCVYLPCGVLETFMG